MLLRQAKTATKKDAWFPGLGEDYPPGPTCHETFTSWSSRRTSNASVSF